MIRESVLRMRRLKRTLNPQPQNGGRGTRRKLAAGGASCMALVEPLAD